jgi:hypothetical protein
VTLIFRENVLEIVNNWLGYPVKGPCDNWPAINAGVVELKCFINNTCPFYKSPFEEDGLVFNESTFKRIQPWLPEDLRNALSVTPSLSGIYLTPRMVFRHNYVYKRIEGVASIDPGYDLFGSFNSLYREVTQVTPGSTNSVAGVDKTRYRPEQSWVVAKSLFDPGCVVTGVLECDAQAEWGYRAQKVSNSAMTSRDVSYDYELAYYNEWAASWDSTDPRNPKLKPNERQRISRSRVQMPVQTRVSDNLNRGIHWRLIKRTPLFKGEDFFIRFYRQATDTVTNPDEKGDPIPFSSEFSRYWPIDITRNDKLPMTSAAMGIDALMRKRNLAISPPTVGNNPPDSKKFDFHDQAYYIIELGMYSPTDNYFIIITERSNPIFVNFVPSVAFPGELSPMVSKQFSEFTKVSGQQLIHSEWFDMIVRNHLGSIVIQFRGDGISSEPWVIKRTDWVPDFDPVSNEPYLKDKMRSLFVPRGGMCLMGGNLRSGFVFGPLQCDSSYLSMIYPPREEVSKNEDMQLAFTLGRPESISARSMSGAFKSFPFFLPTDGAHDILFSSTDIFLQDLSKNVIPVGEAKLNQALFVQDAQYYANYYESKTTRGDGYKYGGFYYDDTIRDFSDMGGARTSNIIVKKYRYLNDPQSRKQAFDIVIGMMAGDHIFTSNYWSSSPPSSRVNADLRPMEHTPPLLLDTDWFLEGCKTPILASLRLISNPSIDPRWPDGTDTSVGINPYPTATADGRFKGQSHYCIDATDHVMAFSDSWSTSSFSEMEHTGTVNFYLNRGMIAQNNVTDALLSLQNKTFYIEIWAGYTRPCQDVPSSYSRQNGLFKLFTGLCHGGTIDYQYGKNIMSCKIEDYTAVLRGTRFFNSPWFDGVKDINCIREIMQMAGFRDVGKYDPGKLIRDLSDNACSTNPGVFFHHFDGRLFKMESYALPSAYNRLDQPSFKFKDGDPYMDAVVEIAKRAGKIFFFDQNGIAHYENFQDIIRNDYMGRVPISPLYRFTTNPEVYPGQLVFNKLERNYDVQSVTNHIKIMSETPDFHLLIGDQLNWSSMENPEAEGFIGYLKTYYQQETMFGSKEAMMDSIRTYSVSFRPKIKVQFETYGVPLRANDIIQVNGENARVVKVNNNIVAEKNEWWMEVETEKYQIIQASRSVS